MGNIGRPSRGCILCCSRRIKCDQRKPHCLRCEKSKRECPGYKHPEKWLFMPQYSVMDESESTSNTSDEDDVAQNPEEPLQTGKPSSFVDNRWDVLYSTPTEDVEARAICLFMKSFVIDTTADGNPGHLDFLPELYAKSSSDSCLRKVVAAASQRNFMNRCCAPQLNRKTVMAYVEALQSTNEALASPVKAILDETIATVHLLGIYELLTPSFVTQSWRAHVRGTLQLLQLRGPDQLKTTRGKQLFRLVHTPILLTAMRTGQEPAQEPIALVRSMQSKGSATNAFPSLVSRFFWHVTMLRAKTLKVVGRLTSTSCVEIRKELMQRLFEIINYGCCLHDWYDFEKEAEASLYWSVQRTTSNPNNPYTVCSDLAEVCSSPYYFKNLYVMAHWARAWTAQLYLNETLGEAVQAVIVSLRSGLRTSNMELLVTLGDLQSRAQSSAQNILFCIGFALGHLDNRGHRLQQSSSSSCVTTSSVGPFYLFYGLETIFKSPYTNEKQKSIAENALQRIGAEWGISRS